MFKGNKDITKWREIEIHFELFIFDPDLKLGRIPEYKSTAKQHSYKQRNFNFIGFNISRRHFELLLVQILK